MTVEITCGSKRTKTPPMKNTTLRLALAAILLGGIAGISTLRADDDGGCGSCHKHDTNAPTPAPSPSGK
jgi:hypothetical protein